MTESESSIGDSEVGSVGLTLVICTRNRASQLQRCLLNLKRIQSAASWELVVVDNGSSDETSVVIERFLTEAPVPVGKPFESRPGTGWARNAGWKAARGAIVAFTDDDCYPDSTFVDRVIAAFEADPLLGFVGGRIALHDPRDLPITVQEYPRTMRLDPRRCIPAGLIQTANLSIRREALEAVGGFDERFGAGTRFPCEDIDLVARISAVGWAGTYDPGPVVYHHHGRRSEAEAEQLMRLYDRGRGAYYAKCLSNPAIFGSTVRHWGRQMLKQPLRTTLREWGAAAEYWFRAGFSRRAGPG